MSMRTIACSSSNRNSASARASSVLPTPVGSEKHEAAERPIGILQSGACAPDRVGHRRDGFVLPDDALMEAFLHVNQLLDLAFHQPAHGDVRPLRDDLGDVLLVDLFLEHALSLLQVGEPGLLLANSPLELRQLSVLQLRGLGVVAGALRQLDVEPHLLELLLQLACVAGSRLSPRSSAPAAGRAPP